MSNPTYDPAKVILTIGGNVITGFMDGTFITVSRDEDLWTPFTGVRGETARTRNRNETGKFVFVLMQTSPSNRILSAQMALDTDAGVPSGAARLSETLSDTDISGDDSYLLKPAEVKYSKTFEGREWTLVIPKMRYFVGGALV